MSDVAPVRATWLVRQVVVAVPARDEETTLGACLESVRAAAAACDVPVVVAVALDRCRDASAGVVARFPEVLAVTSRHGRVGAARRAAVAAGLRAVRTGAAPSPWSATGTWLACTDADSVVPPTWLTHQLEQAACGADLVLGTVALPAGAATTGTAAWRRRYAAAVRADGTHGHVHGANLGIRASAYRLVGGFDARAVAHEDVLLVRTVRARPALTVVTSVAAPVLTSDRRSGRAPDGVAADLRRLDA